MNANSTALVTGATSGIGAEFARQLAERGHDLVLVARNTDRLDKQADELASRYGVSCTTLPADLALRDDVERVADRLRSPVDPIDILINNAGFGFTTILTDEDTSDLERAIDVMALAPLVLGAAAAHTMSPRGHGQIITVASLASWVTQGAYSAIKAFAKVWSEGLSVDLAGTGVTATALCPGWVTTEFHQRAGLAGQARSIPTWAWVSPQRCVREALIDADKGKVLSIPTKRWKIAAFLLQHLPASAVQAISRRLAASKVQ